VPTGGTTGQVLTKTSAVDFATAWQAATGSGGATISVGATPPGSPNVNALWWNSELGALFIYYNDGNSTQWVPASTNTFGGGVVQGPVDLKTQTVTQSGAALAINRAVAENCTLSLTASITAITVSGWPAVGATGKVRLIIVNTGAFTMAGWPAGTIWPGGTAPVITSGAAKRDIILLMSDDAGTTIYGSIVGQDYH
jgi:hypothetical protein